MGLIIFIATLILVLDTGFGNRIFPSPTGVEKFSYPDSKHDAFRVYKWTRILGIPFKMFQLYSDPDRMMLDFTFFRDNANAFYDRDKAIKWAKRLANYSKDIKPVEVIWSSWSSPTKPEKELEELTVELGHAIRRGDDLGRDLIMEKLKVIETAQR